MPIKNCIIVGLAVSAEAFTVGMPATSRPQAVVSRCSVAPEMGLGTFFKKLIGKKESPEVTNFRSQLAGMDSLSGLSELSLEQPEGREGRKAGDWKEYIKSDGRKWYYNVETKKMQWKVPEEFEKLDAIAAAAAAKNEARGTQA